MSHIDKGYRGMAMEGWIAKWYAKLTGKSLDQFQREAKKIAEDLPQGSSILEVAPGPGYLSVELAKLGQFNIVGLDISHSFLRIARENAAQAGVSVDFWQGNASAMPFDDASFDFIICRAAFKNFSEPVKAINEMFRRETWRKSRDSRPGSPGIARGHQGRRQGHEPRLVQFNANRMDLQARLAQEGIFAGRLSTHGG